MNRIKDTELKQLTPAPRGVSRREFIQRSIAAGMTVAAAESLFMKGAAAATPKRGGKAIVGCPFATTSTYDPATFLSSEQTVGLYGAVYNCLLEVGPDRKLHGEIAESWEPSPDARTWTFMLRKGVEFHDGRSVEASDVVASLNHHRGPDTKSAAKSIVESIVDVRADGKHTVVVELREGNADLPYLLTDYHLGILPAKGENTIEWENANGTGAYTLEGHVPGVSMDLKRNPNYFKPDRGWFDEAQLLGITDPVAKNTALVTGKINILHKAEVKTLKLLEQTEGIAIDEVTGTQHYTIPMHANKAPFDDNHVRLALKHAVDREALLKRILDGRGAVANDSPISPANRYFNHEMPQREYDIDKAKYHLKQAGLSSLEVDLSTADTAFPGAVDAAVLYKEHAAKAGITINVVREPNDGYWSNVWAVKPFSFSYWAGRPTEDWIFTLAYQTGASWSESFWSNARFDELLLLARSELDEDKRREMYWEMQELVSNDGGGIIPLFANLLTARSSSIQHAEQVSASFEADGWKCIERWWMA